MTVDFPKKDSQRHGTRQLLLVGGDLARKVTQQSEMCRCISVHAFHPDTNMVEPKVVQVCEQPVRNVANWLTGVLVEQHCFGVDAVARLLAQPQEVTRHQLLQPILCTR